MAHLEKCKQLLEYQIHPLVWDTHTQLVINLSQVVYGTPETNLIFIFISIPNIGHRWLLEVATATTKNEATSLTRWQHLS